MLRYLTIHRNLMAPLDPIEPFPWFLQKHLDLQNPEVPANTVISATEWSEHWRPLLAEILERFQKKRPHRFMVGIAGPPGVGKTIFAEQLNWLVFKGVIGRDARSMALPMDGFHFPQDLLKATTKKLPDGTEIHLSSLKGAPETFDVPAFRHAMQELIGRPEVVSWPGYSRFHHDVQPGKYRVHESTNLVFVEGNYVLLDRGLWQGIPRMFDLKIYIQGPAMKVLSNLMERHIKGGKSVEEAKLWVKKIDLVNTRIVESTKASADVIIEKNHDDDIVSVTWREAQ